MDVEAYQSTQRRRTAICLSVLVALAFQGCAHAPLQSKAYDLEAEKKIGHRAQNRTAQATSSDMNDVTVEVATHETAPNQSLRGATSPSPFQTSPAPPQSEQNSLSPIAATEWNRVSLLAESKSASALQNQLISSSPTPPTHRTTPSETLQVANRLIPQPVTQASATIAATDAGQERIQRQVQSHDEPALIPDLKHLPTPKSIESPGLSPPACRPVLNHKIRQAVAFSTRGPSSKGASDLSHAPTGSRRIRSASLVTRASFEGERRTIAHAIDSRQADTSTPQAAAAQEADADLSPEPQEPISPDGPPDPPPVTGPVKIPLAGEEPLKDIELTLKNGRVSVVTRNAPVQSVLNLLAEQQGLNLIAADDVDGNVSVNLNNVAFEDALNAIVAIAGCTWNQNRGIVLVSKIGAESRGGPDVQGKIVQVFPLNFIGATDVEATVKGLLSPMGQVFVSQASATDKRKTQELVVVEDIPASVSRVAQYIQQIDQAPRQVMIEAHVLQVELKDDTRHGVDWKFLTTYLGRDVSVKSVGFANAAASPASVFSLDGGKLTQVIEALKTTTDAKTLASPQVIVANGQEARIQIGSKLGYFVTTTTQTSTLQNVNFLNTGVLLKVTPQISSDNRVLMVVSPEVSTGRISAAGLPETNTTEAMTTVLLENNGGMVIGGLIKETDSDTQDKVPLLGDLWLVGRLFQKRAIARQRSEIIIVLVPHIAPYGADCRNAEQTGILRATTPLFQNGLQQAPRPFDPRLPDAINNPRRLRASRMPDLFNNPLVENPKPLTHYFPTDDEEFLQPSEPMWGNPGINAPSIPQFEALPQPQPSTATPLPVLEPLEPDGDQKPLEMLPPPQQLRNNTSPAAA